MAKKTQGGEVTHKDILNNLMNGIYAPIYLLMGEESYYIDKISEYMADNIIKPEERDFNLQTIYCTRETQVSDIINSARRFPMMAERQMLIVKEAQNLLKFDDFSIYAENPMKTTILVICYKNGVVDKRKKTVANIDKVGVVYESKRLKEGFLPGFINDYAKRKKVTIDQRATLLLAESIGSDLSRLATEMDKLVLTLPQGQTQITVESIERNIGISKEYNNWELQTAVVQKDVMKVMRIIDYFDKNPKAGSPIMTLAMLFKFFANLMQMFYAPDKSEQGLLAHMEFRSTWQLKDYQAAARVYTPMKTMQIIGKIREADARLKGVGKGNATDGDVMRELMFFILH